MRDYARRLNVRKTAIAPNMAKLVTQVPENAERLAMPIRVQTPNIRSVVHMEPVVISADVPHRHAGAGISVKALLPFHIMRTLRIPDCAKS